MKKLLTISNSLVINSKNFLTIKRVNIWFSLYYFFMKNAQFVGWGRKRSGLWAKMMTKLNGKVLFIEDGFIRSFGLGVNGSPSFSMVKDNIGIYYDATTSSTLEELLNSYNFSKDQSLMKKAKEAKAKILEYKISKYNNFDDINLSYLDTKKEKILIIAQTDGDSSLKYGLANTFSTQEMINDALSDNIYAEIYIKIHPDVLAGRKVSDIVVEELPTRCKVLKENINPLVLLNYFSKIYTKTSGMGFEALLLDKKVYCYGLPFYASWGITEDKLLCPRRVRKLSIDELFAGVYILYSSYYNPYLDKEIDILDVIEYIAKNREGF